MIFTKVFARDQEVIDFKFGLQIEIFSIPVMLLAEQNGYYFD